MSAPAPVPQADPLGEALEFLRLSETAYYHSVLAAPWGLVMPENCPKFHFVVSGRCWLEIDGTNERLLEAGDFVVIPHGRGHRLSSATSAPTVELEFLDCEKISTRYAVFRKGGKGALTTLICGDLNFTHPAAHHLVSLLPKIMHIRAPGDHSADWLDGTMRFMAEEARDLRPGGEAIITRLADILVIQAIRYWIGQNPAELTGWLAALQDKPLARALGLIHREPGKSWTVARLAGAVAMSRSVFAARFTALVGEPVMQYLTRWRMHLAHVHLRAGARSMEEIASLLGYHSGAAFSRAFKRSAGYWPGAVKRAAVDSVVTRAPAHRFLKASAGRKRVAVA